MTTCARCGAEVGDAASCPRCGQMVLSPQAAPPDPVSGWRTDTAERPAVQAPPVEPAPASSTPGPPRFPLYADESPQSYAETAVHEPVPPEPAYLAPAEGAEWTDEGEDDGGGAPLWLPWVIVAVVMVLVAAGGVWLLLSPGGDGSGTDTAPTSANSAEATTSDSPPPASDPAPSQVSSSPAAPSPSETVPAGDPVDVAGQAAASAPSTAPPNEDVYGNRTTYVAGNMLDGSPSTCWRMPGDGTGSELTFTLAAPTSMTQVGLINGYAKKVRVGGRTLNWYVGNRRVLSVQWVFDDGTTVDQALGETTDMQTLDLAAPVTTSTVRLRLVTVSAPGTGRSARNYTAISEVSFVGVPSA